MSLLSEFHNEIGKLDTFKVLRYRNAYEIRLSLIELELKNRQNEDETLWIQPLFTNSSPTEKSGQPEPTPAPKKQRQGRALAKGLENHQCGDAGKSGNEMKRGG